ncbi:MAG: DUF309 domain-containing protein [Planctomyces sp.]|nr:DUF309 domain-containing protein [Planctomyces sp.]
MPNAAPRAPRSKSKSTRKAAPAPISEIEASASIKFVRLLPAADLPRYTHVPGTGTPHPYRDPRGHCFGRKPVNPKPLNEHRWAECRSYLLGLDLFNLGFYWESHDEWERLWRASGPDTMVGKFLKGLVKLAAAGIKVREESIHGVRRHAASAGEVFADVAAETDLERYCGLRFEDLQFAADRAAQLVYKADLETGRPLRVFPYVLAPEPMPLC